MRKLFKLLLGAAFVLACGRLTPAPPPTATPAATAQPGGPTPATPLLPTVTAPAASPAASSPSPLPLTAVATTEAVAPTPTGPPFELPGGRLLLSVYWSIATTSADPNFPWFAHYRWLTLPDVAITPHPVLAGDYPTRDQYVSLAPDRTHLAFAHQTFTQSGDNLYGGATVTVLLTDLDGNQPVQIGPPLIGDGLASALACGRPLGWSADSRVLAFARSSAWGAPLDRPELHVYELDSGQFRTLTLQARQAEVFAVAPDGGRIAFTAYTTDPEYSLNLYVINADGSDEHLVSSGWISSNLIWHPDGTRLFVVNARPELGIYSVDVATGAATKLVATSDQGNCLGLSPDGSLLTYNDFGIWTISPDGGEPRRLTDARGGLDARNLGLTWSPDGRYFAFNFKQAIHIMDPLSNRQVVAYHEDKQEVTDVLGWLP